MLSLWVAALLAVSDAGTPSTRNPPEMPARAGCDLRIAGLDDPAAFRRFFDELKAGLHDKDLGTLSRLVSFPLRVSVKKGKPPAVRTPADLKRAFTRVFNDNVRSAVAAQTYNSLFCRDQGVMFGNGQLWVAPMDQNGARSIRVTAVNPDAPPVSSVKHE